MLIKLENNAPTDSAPLTESNFRQLFPQVSFPKHLTPGDVESFGYGLFEFAEKPQAGKYEKVVETLPQQDAKGIWVQSYETVPAHIVYQTLTVV